MFYQSMLCFVLGCNSSAIMSARHPRFGRVACCSGHNPIRSGYALPIVSEGVRVPEPAAIAPPATGGQRVKVTPPKPAPKTPSMSLRNPVAIADPF